MHIESQTSGCPILRVPRISYYAAQVRTTCAAFSKESRMKFVDADYIDRKSGFSEGWDPQNSLEANSIHAG
jgi:hypothetical protein